MKTAALFAMAIAVIANLPLLAQQSEEGKATYSTQGAMSYGDEASSRAYEMTSLIGVLQGRLSAKTAKAGDQVVLKTTDKAQTSDGTTLPRGTRLLGRITEVRAQDAAHNESEMGIVFDRAEIKSGQSLAIHVLIRGVSAPAAATRNRLDMDDSMSTVGMPTGGGAAAGGERGEGRSGGVRMNDGGEPAGGVANRTGERTSPVAERAGAETSSVTGGAVEAAGHGSLGVGDGAHDLAAMRAIPRTTAIAGVLLAGSESSSGVFSASGRNVELASGTEMHLGVVADR